MQNRPLLRRIGCCFVAVLAFVATAILLHAVLPFPDIEEVRPKLHFFGQNKAGYDTVFVGSSRIKHGIECAEFDRLLRDAGQQSTSFNFGIGAMTPPESFFVARALLDLRLPTLRRMFIELNPLRPHVIPQYATTMRAVYWHDVKHTAIAVRHNALTLSGAMRSPNARPQWKRARQSAESIALHLKLAAQNYANLGRGLTLWTELRSPKRNKHTVGPGRDGFFPMKGRRKPADEAQTDVVAERESARAGRRHQWFHEAEFTKLAAEARSRGIELILLIPPLGIGAQFFQNDAEIRRFAFDNPEFNANLHSPDRQADAFHLNATGAREFTTALATEFARAIPR